MCERGRGISRGGGLQGCAGNQNPAGGGCGHLMWCVQWAWPANPASYTCGPADSLVHKGPMAPLVYASALPEDRCAHVCCDIRHQLLLVQRGRWLCGASRGCLPGGWNGRSVLLLPYGVVPGGW